MTIVTAGGGVLSEITIPATGPVLLITNGTSADTVDLLGTRNGYILCDWRPARPPLEFGLNRNWLSGTEVPVSVVQKSMVDTFTLKARDVSADTLIAHQQELNRILYLAAMYWTNNKLIPRPYYIVARSKGETNERYTAILSAQLHDSGNPYAQPFASMSPAEEDLIVAITHGDWLDYFPGSDGQSMRTNISSTLKSYITGRNVGVGSIRSSSVGIPLVNSANHMNLTYLYRGDEFTNMMLADLGDGFNLFVEGGSDDSTYFGCIHDEPKPDFGLRNYFGIYFELEIPDGPGGSPPTIAWQYWSGSAWVTLDTADSTAGLTQSGYVLFDLTSIMPFDQRYLVKNKVAFWIRANPSGTFGGKIPIVKWHYPTLANLPFFDVALAQSPEYQEIPDSEGAPVGTTPPDGANNSELLYEITEDSEAAAGNEPFTLTFDATDTGVASSRVRWAYFPRIIGDQSVSYRMIQTAEETTMDVEFNPVGGLDVTDANGDIPFTVTLYVKDRAPHATIESFWTVDTGATGGTIRVAPDFTIDNASPIAGVTSVEFDSARSYISLGTDTVASYTWYFGDGESSTGALVYHTYDDIGVMNVTLEITLTSGKVCRIRKQAAVYVTALTIASIASSRQRGFAPFSPNFSGASSLAEDPPLTYAWDFGDGTSGTGVNPDKTYTEAGIYTVRLVVTDNSANTHTDIKENYIYVDSGDLKAGDNGAFLGFNFEIPSIPWRISGDVNEHGYTDLDSRREYWYPFTNTSTYRMYIGAKSILTDDDKIFQGYFPVVSPGYGTFSQNGEGQGGAVWTPSTDNIDIVAEETSSTGYVFIRNYWDQSVNQDREFARLRFPNDVMDVYKGTYKVFIRLSGESAYGDLYWSVGVAPGDRVEGAYYGSDRLKRIQTTRRVTTKVYDYTFLSTLDLGSVTLGGGLPSDQSIVLYVARSAADVTSWADIRFHDMILIPQDEWYGEVDFPIAGRQETSNLVIGSTTADGNVAAKYYDGDGVLTYIPTVVPGKPLSVTNVNTRFVSLLAVATATGNAEIPAMISYIDQYYSIMSVDKINRYLGSRGSS